MDLISLLIMITGISIFDEIVNGKLQAPKKLLNWLDRKVFREDKPEKS